MDKKLKYGMVTVTVLILTLLAVFSPIFPQAAVVEIKEKSEFEKEHIRKSSLEAVTMEKVLTNNSASVTLNNWDRRIELIGVELPEYKEIQGYFDKGLLPKNEQEHIKTVYSDARGALKEYATKGDVLYIEQDVRQKNAFGNLLVYLYSPNRKIINVELVRAGYAYPVTDIDNKKYEAGMKAALDYAIDHKNGLYKVWLLRLKSESTSGDKKGKVVIEKIVAPEVR